jgi:hypothetical protein
MASMRRAMKAVAEFVWSEVEEVDEVELELATALAVVLLVLLSVVIPRLWSRLSKDDVKLDESDGGGGGGADIAEVPLPDWLARFDTNVSNSDLLMEPLPLVSIALKSWSAAVVVPVAESSCDASCSRATRDPVSVWEPITEFMRPPSWFSR